MLPRIAVALLAVLLAVGCAGNPHDNDPDKIRVALVDSGTRKRVVENVRYSILSSPLLDAIAASQPATRSNTRVKAFFERHEVEGINALGHTLPIDLKLNEWLLVEHPDYFPVIIEHKGDEAWVRMGSTRGQVQMQDIVEFPPLDMQRPKLKSERMTLKRGHLLLIMMDRSD